MGAIEVELEHHGSTHSPDHIGVFFPGVRVLYGGCAVRHGDSLGNVREAEDYAAWLAATRRLQTFGARLVVPGHESRYAPDLLENTVRLLEREIARDPAKP